MIHKLLKSHTKNVIYFPWLDHIAATVQCSGPRLASDGQCSLSSDDIPCAEERPKLNNPLFHRKLKIWKKLDC